MASNLGENLTLAYDTVRAHKLRSALTILGVLVGTVTLMAIGSILTGLNQSFVDQLNSFGTNSIFVYKFQPGIHTQRLSREERLRPPISDSDIAAVRAGCTECATVSAEVFNNSGSVNGRYRQHEVDGLDFSGTEPNYPESNNQPVAEGRYFTASENEHRENVVVIGGSVAEALFPGEDAVGQEFTLDGNSFRVLGVFAPRNAAGASQQDLSAKIPYLTYNKLYPAVKEHFLQASALPGRIDQAQDQIREILRRNRKDAWNAPDSFGIATAASIIQQFHDITAQVALVIVVVASIGMLIGGVGVMNIMLVSVTERTREIGVRKAIGARRQDIIQQFLAEAVFLTGCGGLLGIAGGWMISLGLRLALPSLPTSVPFWSVALGFGLSVAIGVFFGLFPAVKAAQLDPVVALRYE